MGGGGGASGRLWKKAGLAQRFLMISVLGFWMGSVGFGSLFFISMCLYHVYEMHKVRRVVMGV